MSDSQLTQGQLLPFRLYDEHEVVNWYALATTGLNGQFVSFVTGNQSPANSAGGYGTNTPVAAQFTNTVSNRYINTRQVRVTQSGDLNFNTLGITLHTTAEYDENGNRLINWPYNHVLERGFVLSGWSVPVLKRGVVTLKSSAYNGTPIPGYVGCISTGSIGGKIDIVNPTALVNGPFAAGAYGDFTVVGKFYSSSGSAFGGYAQFGVGL